VIGAKIKTIRKDKGLTLATMAELLKLKSTGHLSQIERGEKEPSDALINNLKATLSISEIWWETGEGEMFTHPYYNTEEVFCKDTTRVKAVRLALNMSVADFANKLSVSKETISAIEAGEEKPTIGLSGDIIYEFKVMFNWWQTGQGEIFHRHSTHRLFFEADMILGLKSDKEIADLLGKDEATVKGWRTSKDIPIADEYALLSRIEESERKLDALSCYGFDDDPGFVEDLDDIPPPQRKIPIISWAQVFENSSSVVSGFADINRPSDLIDPMAYALIVSDVSMSPRYEPGDILLVSPGAWARKGDAVLKLKGGDVMVKKVKATNSHYVLESFNPDDPSIECQKEDVLFVHRVVWVKRGE
jgi:transcriptional regulator with XRE-family HTH domain/SOS-response transcriptional repressor LexA